MNLDEDVISDLKKFWDISYQLRTGSKIGCTVLCAFVKMKLVNENHVMDEDHINAFTEANGGDELMAKRLVSLHRLCVISVNKQPDECVTYTEILMCLRYGLGRLNWAPSAEDVSQHVAALGYGDIAM